MEHAGEGDGGGDRRGAGRGRGRNSWTPGTEHQQLRRPQIPNQTGAVHQINEMFNNASINDVVKNSELSVDAPEFVPKGFVAPQLNGQGWPRHSVQERLTAARSGQGMPHAHHHYGSHHQYPYHVQQMPYHHQYGESEHPSQSYQRYESGYGNYDRNQGPRLPENSRVDQTLQGSLSHLSTAMQTLTRNPDQFDNLVVPLVCTITPHLKNKESTEAIVNAIIQKCIIDSNFRYSGARLCSHLDAVETPSKDNPSIFRTALYERCRDENDNQSTNWPKIVEHTPDDERKCHGLMLSLAELVAQMDSHPASILGKVLVDLISNTLKNPGPNSAKYICQSLKLAGQYLERDSTTNRQEIERVMRELTDLVTKGQVDVHVGRMVNSVQELRSVNWGRGVSFNDSVAVDVNPGNVQVQQKLKPSSQQVDEPVLYGPDGMVLSAEERRFCQDLSSHDAGDDWASSLETPQQEEDEDDMIADAYEEFLKLAPNKNDNSNVNRGK
ncbi:polyadenylate-binding protein-interacting protein 1 isoform X2 [Diachasma alloeum]|uniref:polyadenylate-binding protein-interacting protein 1 isoform X2 n=1 Tax=Diachasma alloeum TaxID=454923 RepID=UPI000738279B|nr:polyadenylate-binding protein-interacting protein 1 isoform X2 [Diachasma alloeum]